MTTDMALPDGHSRDRRRDPWFATVHVLDLVVWYAVSAVVVFVVPTFARQGVPPWAMPAGDEIQAWYWVLAFVIAASGITLLRAIRGGVSLVSGGVVIAAPWALAFIALMLRSSIAQSRLVALVSVSLGVLLLAIPALIPTRRVAIRAAIVAAAIAAAGAGARSMAPPPPPAASLTTFVNTALMPLEIHYETGIVQVADVPGGAITTFGSGLLLATGAGSWYEITWDSGGERLRARPLPFPAPTARDGLAGVPPAVLLRVTGLAVDMSSDAATVFVAHEVWDSDTRCLALRVSAMRLNGLTPVDSAWRPVYVTEPCLATSLPGFDPYESGGRLLLLPDGALLLTVGDYGVNEDSATALAQQPDADYGKTIRIERGGKHTVYTMGHRNPSGLASDRDGNLWVAEHGPRGGDEINVLRAGANYGWPLTTYGTAYGSYRWRFRPPAMTSPLFTGPAFVLVPSVAFSSLISVHGRLFEHWSGDLLAGSLSAQQLLRIRIEGARAVYAEPIQIDRRIRDLVEAPNGRIVLWTDVGDLVWLAPSSDLLLGAVAYEACARCHGPVNEPDPRPTGPALAGIFGKRIAADPEFEFSDALKRVGGQWTEARLEAFLTSPSAFAPGTTMQFPGLPDSTQRRALVEYIRRGGG